MSFGMWLLAFFCAPAYFLVRRRWVAFIIHGCIYAMAVLLVFSVVGALAAPLFWLIGVAHAGWDMRAVLAEQAMQRQAELIAQKMTKDKEASS